MARADRTDLPDGESGIFFAMGLDMKSLICPSRLGKYSRRLSTRRISFAVVAHAAGRRRIFIAPPSATENGFLLVREPIEYLPSLVGHNCAVCRDREAGCSGLSPCETHHRIMTSDLQGWNGRRRDAFKPTRLAPERTWRLARRHA